MGKVVGLAVCEQYRMSLMALVDGELTGPERIALEEHLDHCAYCNEEYNDILRLNQATTDAVALSGASTISLDNYYRGVCHKMESGASWAAWSLVSLLLAFAGTLMIFGCQGATLAIFAGSIALAAAASLVVISYYCNCCGK